MHAERQERLNRIQIWGFVVAAVGAALTLPIVGVAFALAAVALTYRTPLPPARAAGLGLALLCLVLGSPASARATAAGWWTDRLPAASC